MSISVLFEKTIVTNNYSGVIIAPSNITNSIFGQKNGTKFPQIGRILLTLAGFQILNSNFQLKNLLLRVKAEIV
jgi:hypothetical protein